MTDEGVQINKIKGVSHDASSGVTFEELEGLLYRNTSLEFSQERWRKNILSGSITIEDIVYHLKVTSNKRECLYDNNDRFVNTAPYNYDEIISNDKEVRLQKDGGMKMKGNNSFETLNSEGLEKTNSVDLTPNLSN